MPTKLWFGGSFAPPLDLSKITHFRALADSASEQVREVMLALCEMVQVFQETPASKEKGTPHPSGKGQIVPLADEEVVRIWDYVPWPYEIEAYRGLFDPLPNDTPEEKALRNAAFHLLWYAEELTKDREPMTTDRLVTASPAESQ